MKHQERRYTTCLTISARVEGNFNSIFSAHPDELAWFYGDESSGQTTIRFDSRDAPAYFEGDLLKPSIPFFDMLDLLSDEGADTVLDRFRNLRFTYKQMSEINFIQEGVYVKMPVQHFNIAKPLKGARSTGEDLARKIGI